jgi:hypothetical protein
MFKRAIHIQIKQKSEMCIISYNLFSQISKSIAVNKIIGHQNT